jgi:hypothetical protein
MHEHEHTQESMSPWPLWRWAGGREVKDPVSRTDHAGICVKLLEGKVCQIKQHSKSIKIGWTFMQRRSTAATAVCWLPGEVAELETPTRKYRLLTFCMIMKSVDVELPTRISLNE